MVDFSNTSTVMQVHNLRDFFRTSIDDVAQRQGVEIDPPATQYVVNLLTLFSRSDQLYEDHGEVYGLKPLALMLADAVDAEDPNQRSYALQRIGDVALFMSGFFIESLANKAVDVDYYIHMGENAYGSLSDEVRGTARGKAFAHIYRELAQKFQTVVDVLNEVRDGGSTAMDIMRTYEVWMRTGSERAATQLREEGIIPIPGMLGPKRH